MKKLLYIVMALSLTLFVGCQSNNSNESFTGDNSENSSGNGEVKLSAIGYCYWDSINKLVKDIPDFMWKPQGNYPNEYVENKQQIIDDLRNYRKNNDIIYAFEGWYYDTDYTYKLNANTIDFSMSGDITLYAKIVEREKRNSDIVTASITYQWDDFGLGQEGIEKMKEGIDLPTEYIEGQGIALPKLKTWKQSSKVSYRFVGWYYDSNFSNQLIGESISKTQTGNVIIYPSIEIWVG